MAKPVKGDVVVLPFPFSDLTRNKRRPALVIADLDGDDLILCQITTQVHRDAYSVSLEPEDFVSGRLDRQSSIRPNRLFTAENSIILYRIGSVRAEKLSEVVDSIIQILQLS